MGRNKITEMPARAYGQPKMAAPCNWPRPAPIALRRACGLPGAGARPASMPRTALFAGSFDPVTNGHLDVVRQAVRLADRLVLAIGTHPGKTPLFAAEERRAMVEETCGALARASGC